MRLVPPGSDEYVTERDAAEIGLLLQQWSESFRRGTLLDLKSSFHPGLEASPLASAKETTLRSGNGIETRQREFSTTLVPGADRLLHELTLWIGSAAHVETAEFEITALDELPGASAALQLRIRYSLVIAGEETRREQRVGYWRTDWIRETAAAPSPSWKLRRWLFEAERRGITHGSAFVDVTQQALGAIPSYTAQMLHGSDHWRTVLDGASGIDVYGNNGIAAGDFDNDGFDDLYISQPAGLPNRLYRNRGDGTFEDVTEKAGVGVLDNTACALFADFRNLGRQDLLVVCGSGPLLFLNQGDGTFSIKHDAFQFARPPQGTFTHAAVADYDRDGRLDIYFCLYSYYLGLDQYHYPAPYFDARNGPPNFLLHNQGNGTFVDRTEASGLMADNDRYSFACAWGEASSGGAPDLYVVNDFGRNNLYRSNGDGTFRSASAQAHVEEVGAGMSACWGDYNNDARQDLYAANMWSAAGQRVSQQALFHQRTPHAVRSLYQRHARGNALYRNHGDGGFDDAGDQAGVEVGRWAWCSDFLDFDHDGYPDLYITNGYITAPGRTPPASPSASAQDSADRQPTATTTDLSSFFWRQVVAKSPNDATPSLAYEHGWNALNELIRSDSSWSGNERNVLLANNRNGTFTEVSGAVGLDFLEDGRSFALADLDHDGRLEIILKNRNGPQLRIVRNQMQDLGDSIAFRLQGTTSNRDAIGAAITLDAGDLHQTRYLQAGSGFLAQHSKELFFGLGKSPAALRATVRWPSGLTQHFENLPPNSRIHLEEGKPTVIATPFPPPSAAIVPNAIQPAPVQRTPPAQVETWLIDPLRAPSFSLPDLSGTPRTLNTLCGRCTLLTFWATTSPPSLDQLRGFQQHHAAMTAHQLTVVAVNVDTAETVAKALALAMQEHLSFPVLFSTEEVAGIYNIIVRYLFDRRRDLVLPTSLLLDSDGMIVKIYQNAVAPAQLLEDARSLPSTAPERVRKALPFTGALYHGDFLRNDFTYGVAMFQHGYLDEAAASFQQVVAARPDDAEGYYNLGTLNLRRKDLPQAKQYLQKTLELKPNYPEAWNNLGLIAAQQGQPDEAIQHFRHSLEQRPTYATALLNLGNVYRRQGASADAQDCLTRALALQPDDPEANYSLGMFYAQQGQLQPAAEYLEKAAQFRPDYPEALNNLGVLFIRQQEFARAEQQFRTCIRLAPAFEQSYLNLARLYVVQHDTAKARQVLEDLLRLQPDNATGKQGLQALDASP